MPQAPLPSPTLQQMPDGSYRLSGLGKGGRVHLRKAMRAWTRQDDEQTGAAYYFSWSRQEAETYARHHGLTIHEPSQS